MIPGFFFYNLDFLQNLFLPSFETFFLGRFLYDMKKWLRLRQLVYQNCLKLFAAFEFKTV